MKICTFESLYILFVEKLSYGKSYCIFVGKVYFVLG